MFRIKLKKNTTYLLVQSRREAARFQLLPPCLRLSVLPSSSLPDQEGSGQLFLDHSRDAVPAAGTEAPWRGCAIKCRSGIYAVRVVKR